MTLRKKGVGVAAVVLFAGAIACAPALKAPRESIRLTGTVEDVVEPTPTPAMPSAAAAPQSGESAAKPAKPRPLQTFPTLHHMPLGVAVYEACSPQIYLFKRCPGRFLGEAKLVKPGPFVVEIDTQAEEVIVFGFRGFLGPDQQQEACAETKISLAQAGTPITLRLEVGTCSIKLERRYG
jgi:hypothetical protein